MLSVTLSPAGGSISLVGMFVAVEPHFSDGCRAVFLSPSDDAFSFWKV